VGAPEEGGEEVDPALEFGHGVKLRRRL
jgi:hypothetical protein